MSERVRAASPQDRRESLRADCSRCAALCCVAPAFVASADFVADAGVAYVATHWRGHSAHMQDRAYYGDVALEVADELAGGSMRS